MPNFKKHVTVGAVVGGGGNFLWQLSQLYASAEPPKNLWDALGQIDYGKVAIFAAGGAACAALPDILEPATSPNHRELFHSISCAGVVSYGAFGKHSQAWSVEDRHAIRMAALSYLSHLWLDGETPKGLPFI